jgi:Transglycosylase SLT domain
MATINNPPTVNTPPSNYAYSSPEITLEIYPQSGGKLTISGGNAGVLQAIIKKNIREKEGGRFIIDLAPGGPNGINDSNSWTNIININSLAVISLSRGGSQRIVMIGIILEISESQEWTNQQVHRTIKLIGTDFTWYFTSFSFYSLTYLGLISTNLPVGASGYLLGLWGKMFQGNPSLVAYEYLNYIMLGVGNPSRPGVLDNTYIYYQGNKLYLRQIFGWWFENLDVFMPFLADLVNSEGNWMDKFYSFLPWPYYEFFITTAETGDYPVFAATTPTTTVPSVLPPTTTTTNITTVPTNIITNTNHYPNVFPAVIGRINPLPWVEYPVTPSTTISNVLPPTSVVPAVSGTTEVITGGVPIALPPTIITSTVVATSGNRGNSSNINLHNTRWNNLPIYSLGSYSFIDSKVDYNSFEVANFFGIQTVDSDQIAQNGGGIPEQVALELFGGVIDLYSINTYGYRPKFVDLRWSTLFGSLGVSGSIDPLALSTELLGQLASYYIPAANMLQGTVSFPLWPDILAGNRFIYTPFKNDIDTYMFYIEGFTHNYIYGGRSFTTLDISRGLKQTEYNDSSTLSNILMDVVSRKDGVFTTRTDLNTNLAAYKITTESVAARSGINNFPWALPPPTITITNPGFPTGTPSNYDSSFIVAAAGTTCGSTGQITPELLKSIGYKESGINNSAINPMSGAIGIMQVLPGQGFDDARLASDPAYNIQSGAQVLCNKLMATGGNLYQALAFYGGYSGGYSEPGASIYVNGILQNAMNSPTLTG